MPNKIYNTEQSYLFNISQLSLLFGVDRKTVRKRLDFAGITSSAKKSGNKVYLLSEAATAIVSFEKQARDLVYRVHGR